MKSIQVIFHIFIISFVTSNKVKNVRLCQSETCKQTAHAILEKLNKSMDPCENFYRFACGNYIENARIPEDKQLIFSHDNGNFEVKLRELIENLQTHGGLAFHKLKTYYDTCMITDQTKNNTYDELGKIIKKFGDWPVLAKNSWNESLFNWNTTVFEFRKNGLFFEQFISIKVEIHLMNHTKNMIMLQTPSLISKEIMLRRISHNLDVQNYFERMVDIATMFGAERNYAMQELNATLDFEFDLAKLIQSFDEKNLTNLKDGLMTIETLQREIPGISWLEYLNTIMSPHVTLQRTDEIFIFDLTYFRSLVEFLTSKPKRLIANYIFLRAIFEVNPDFSKWDSSGISVTRERWQGCLDRVKTRFPLIMGAMYVRKNFSRHDKPAALKMIERIRENFQQIIPNIDWMSRKSKDLALEKLNHMTMLIAHPDELLDDAKLDEYYKNLDVDHDSLVLMDLNYRLFETGKEFEKFRQPTIKFDWTGIYGNAAVVNAIFFHLQNAIIFPTGFLKVGFNNPQYLHYGSIGAFMGHEMMHGFDDIGHLFDKDGSMAYLWDDETDDKYKKKKQCFIDQYNGYKANEHGNNTLTVNGKQTLNENISDNGGLKLAYYAYDSLAKEIGEEFQLPGLTDYSPRQMFWIGHAEFQCAKYKPSAYVDTVTNDNHAPSEFRVIGAVSNLAEFARDFQCKPGSPMNPLNKCDIL